MICIARLSDVKHLWKCTKKKKKSCSNFSLQLHPLVILFLWLQFWFRERYEVSVRHSVVKLLQLWLQQVQVWVCYLDCYLPTEAAVSRCLWNSPGLPLHLWLSSGALVLPSVKIHSQLYQESQFASTWQNIRMAEHTKGRHNPLSQLWQLPDSWGTRQDTGFVQIFYPVCSSGFWQILNLLNLSVWVLSVGLDLIQHYRHSAKKIQQKFLLVSDRIHGSWVILKFFSCAKILNQKFPPDLKFIFRLRYAFDI